MKSIGKLRVDAALPRLLERVRHGGEEAETAAQAAAHLGAKGTHALQNLMGQVAPGLRRRIASALAAGGTASAETAAVDVLLDSDPNLVDAAARSLLEKIPSFESRHRRALTEQVLKLLTPRRNAPLAAHSETALLRVLAGIKDPRGESVFWARVGPSHPPELRAAALQALGTLPPPDSGEKLKQLLACAADPDFRVVAPALMILKAVPVKDRALADWLALFAGADPAARRFAIGKLGHKDTPTVARALLAQLDHPDRSLREQALTTLGQLSEGRAALTKALSEAETPERAWTLGKALIPFGRECSPDQRKKIFARACTFLEAGDRRADPLLHFLREIEGKELQARLEDRALALRKKKQYADAIIYLRLLARDPSCGDLIRFELAACGLKVSDHSLDAEARAVDPSIEQFAGLVHRRDVDPLALIEKAKWLDVEDLFYLGFHFVERSKDERDFGAGVLRLVLRRAPKTKLAKDARNKLRSQGLD
jgi:HEAT repeat protein